jgi:hypothetical protein
VLLAETRCLLASETLCFSVEVRQLLFCFNAFNLFVSEADRFSSLSSFMGAPLRFGFPGLFLFRLLSSLLFVVLLLYLLSLCTCF